jgi:hypothetical protein
MMGLQLTYMIAIMVVPCPIAIVQQAIDANFAGFLFETPVLDRLPDSLRFPNGMHPVLVSSSLDSSISQSSAYIAGSLRGTGFYVPYTRIDALDTPVNTPLVSFLGGTDNTLAEYLRALGPASVSSTVVGLPIAVGTFEPKDAAYQSIGTSPNGNQLYSSTTKFAFIPNFLTGPGVYPAAVSMFFSSNESESLYTVNQIADMMNQPNPLNGLFNKIPFVGITQCQQNSYYFTNQTANVQYRVGNVTFGPSAGSLSAGLFPGTLQNGSPAGAGNYVGVHGVSACVQIVGYNAFGGQLCKDVANNVDEVTT